MHLIFKTVFMQVEVVTVMNGIWVGGWYLRGNPSFFFNFRQCSKDSSAVPLRFTLFSVFAALYSQVNYIKFHLLSSGFFRVIHSDLWFCRDDIKRTMTIVQCMNEFSKFMFIQNRSRVTWLSFRLDLCCHTRRFRSERWWSDCCLISCIV